MAYKKNYKKRSNYKPRKKSTAKKSYSPSQKKSWLAGFMAGIKSMKKKKSAENKRKASLEWQLSSRYAEHMGRKYGLSRADIEKNKQEHYRQARSDVGFFNDLMREYGENI